MKLIIQIPCYNEEQTLPATLASLPRQTEGVDRVEWLVIDDGSADRSAEVAREHGVDHVVSYRFHQGLARAFMIGLDASLRAGADIIVNTDADNQYSAASIPDLIRPIVAGEAQIVVGARPIDQIEDFSLVKKLLQKVGSWVVRQASDTAIPDAPSGFRAISRKAAMGLNVFDDYTYTLETIIQAGQKNIPITSVPVQTNRKLRESRLARSEWSYLWRSAVTILRVFLLYRPLRAFALLSVPPTLAGVLLCFRWLWLFLFEDATRGRVPSLILALMLLGVGAALFLLGLIADLMGVNRKILEDIQFRQRRRDYAEAREDAPT